LGLLVSCGGGDDGQDAGATGPAKKPGTVKPPEPAPKPPEEVSKEPAVKPPEPAPKPVEKPPEEVAPKPPEKVPAPPVKKEYGKAGESAVGVSYACPVEGCTFTSAAPGTCLKHGETKLKQQWFVCPKCADLSVQKGKCKKCGVELKRILK
jgi:hypothetical protein